MWECPLCGEQVTTRMLFAALEHLATKHRRHVNGERDYTCMCGEFTCKDWMDLETHYRYTAHDWPRILTTRELESM